MSWDLVARWYRPLEYAVFGRSLERCREHFIPQISEAALVLIVGDGDGRFLARFAAAAPKAIIDAVDISPGMIALARARTNRANVSFHCADATEAHFEQASYDLIATHFFLDCFDERSLATLVQRLAQATAPGSRWVISEFQQPPHGVWKYAGRLLIATMYLFFRLTTRLNARHIPHYGPLLEAAGFQLETRRTFSGGLLAAELWRRG